METHIPNSDSHEGVQANRNDIHGGVRPPDHISPVEEQTERLQQLTGMEPDTSGNILIAGAADRFMPSPQSADGILKRLRPNGMYNWIAKNERQSVSAQLEPLDEGTERAVHRMMLERLTECPPTEKLTIDPKSAVVCGSVMESIHSILHAMDPEGQAIIGTITPTYVGLLNVPCRSRFTIEMEESEQGWSVPLNHVENMLRSMAAATGGKKILLLCNPNNPNGHVYSKEELHSITALCKKYGVQIIVDEVWRDLVHKPHKETTSVLEAAQKEGYAAGVSVVYGVGKTFNTAAFPCSLMVVPDSAVRGRLQVTRPSQQAALAAIECIKEEKDYLQALRKILRRNATLACATLNTLGFEASVPDGTSVLFFRARPGSPHTDQQNIIQVFRQAGFELHEGNYYGMPYYWRMNIGCPTHHLETNLRRLSEVFS